MKTYIFIDDKNSPTFFKVGISEDPDRRLNEVRTKADRPNLDGKSKSKTPNAFKLCQWNDASLEELFFQYFEALRIDSTEWFHYPTSKLDIYTLDNIIKNERIRYGSSLNHHQSIENIDLKLIDYTDYNPDTRTQDNPEMRSLINSIRELGVIYPVLVAMEKGRYKLIEGNRRTYACNCLQAYTIPAMIIHDSESAERIYSSINSNVKKHSDPQLLDTYLKNPKAVEENVRKKFDKLAKEYDESVLQELQKQKKGTASLTEIKQIVKWYELFNDTTMSKTEKVDFAIKVIQDPQKLMLTNKTRKDYNSNPKDLTSLRKNLKALGL